MPPHSPPTSFPTSTPASILYQNNSMYQETMLTQIRLLRSSLIKTCSVCHSSGIRTNTGSERSSEYRTILNSQSNKGDNCMVLLFICNMTFLPYCIGLQGTNLHFCLSNKSGPLRIKVSGKLQRLWLACAYAQADQSFSCLLAVRPLFSWHGPFSP